ncbi:MAG: hypothetical protein OXF98_03975 [Rhodospirillaceae bacterium]|nr:hypothetical protein [Rhodospirillaceae bacterium]
MNGFLPSVTGTINSIVARALIIAAFGFLPVGCATPPPIASSPWTAEISDDDDDIIELTCTRGFRQLPCESEHRFTHPVAISACHTLGFTDADLRPHNVAWTVPMEPSVRHRVWYQCR